MEMEDSYGMTAVFHTYNHGFSRVGDQHGYFRRLLSWDFSQHQLDDLESLARDSALPFSGSKPKKNCVTTLKSLIILILMKKLKNGFKIVENKNNDENNVEFFAGKCEASDKT